MNSTSISNSQAFMWNHFARIFDYGITYLLSIILARTLLPDEYGNYITLLSFATTVIIFVGLGIDESLNKFIPQTDKNSRSSYLKFLFFVRLISLCTAIFLIALFNNAIKDFLHINNGTYLLAILVVYIFSQSLTNFFINYHTAELRTKTIFIINASIKFSLIAGCLFVIYLDGSVLNLFLVIATLSLFSFIIYFALNNRFLFYKTNFQYYKNVMRFSLIVWLNALLAMILGRYSDILLINYLLNEPRLTGYYEIAFSVCLILEYIFTIGFMGVGLSMLSKASLLGNDNLNTLRIKLIKYHQISVIPVGVFLYVYAHEIIPFIFSEKYNEAVPLLRTYLVFTLFVVGILGSGTNVGALLSIGKEKFSLFPRIIIGTSNLLVNIYVIPHYGISAAILVTGIAYSLTYLSDFIFITRFVGFRYDFLFLTKTVIVISLSLGFVLTVSYFIDFHFIFKGIIMTVLVISGYYLFKLDNELNQRIKKLLLGIIK